MRTLLLMCLLVVSVVANAQTDEEKKVIRSKSNIVELERLAIRYKEQQAQLMKYAKQTGWIDAKGFSKDVKVDDKVKFIIGMTHDKKPIYGTTLDQYVVNKARAQSLYSGGDLGLNVHGEGMTSGVFEPNYVYTGHPLFENRVTQVDLPSILPTVDSYMDHGTHVTGIIASSNTRINVGPNEALFPSIPDRLGDTISVLGVAFKSNVRAFTAGNAAYNSALEAADGLLVANYSYVTSSYNGQYDVLCKDWDDIMVNAPYFLTVMATGNAGSAGPQSHPVGDQLTNINKNGLAIGAAGYRPSLTYIIPASSAGPTDDGRIKPDLISAGSGVYSAVTGTWTLNNPLAAQGIAAFTGTSMAAPGVTGVVLLMQQHFNDLKNRFMRSATVKALLINSAIEDSIVAGPNVSVGWGRVDAKNAAQAISNMGGKSIILEDSLGQSGVYQKNLVADGSEPLLATICWTDPVGSVATMNNDTTSRLVNDLDIRLVSIADSTIYYPWKLDESNLTGPAVKGDNRKDNVEKVHIANPGNGQGYVLSVRHKGTLVNSGQRFSLVVTGLKDCASSKTVSAAVNGLEPDHQEASQKITSNNRIYANSEGVYHAGEEVLLVNGFTASNNSIFRAYIEGCTKDYGARKGVSENREVTTYNNPTLPFATNQEVEEHAPNTIFPNPSTGSFFMELDGVQSGSYQILDINGKVYSSQKFENADQLNIHIEAYNPGIYLLKVKSENFTTVQKMIKK